MNAERSSDDDDVRSGGRPAQPGAGGAEPLFSLSLDATYTAQDLCERHSEAATVDAARQERDRRDMPLKVNTVFESGLREVMMVSLPSDFCTDGGRRINNNLPGWQARLPAGARAFLTFWRDALRPGGFGLGARILTFPGGMLGDLALFVAWPQSRR